MRAASGIEPLGRLPYPDKDSCVVMMGTVCGAHHSGMDASFRLEICSCLLGESSQPYIAGKSKAMVRKNNNKP